MKSGNLFFVRFLRNALYSGFGSEKDGLFLTRVSLFNSFSLLSSGSLILFGFQQAFANDQYVIGIFELALGVLIIFNAILFRFSKDIDAARHILSFAVFVVLLFLLITGGIEGTGILWFLMFPGAVFFLNGKRQGLLWMVCLYLASVAVVVLEVAGVLNTAYSFLAIRQMFFVMGIITALVYVYENKRESDERIIEQRTMEFSVILEHLPVGIMLARVSTGEIVSVNNAASDILGAVRNEKTTKAFEFIREDGSPYPGDELPLSVTLNTGAPATRSDVFVRHKDGAQVALKITRSDILGAVRNEKTTKAFEFIREDGSPYPGDELPLSVTLNTGAPAARSDVFVRHKDGAQVALKITSVPVKNDVGRLESVIVVIVDMTKEHELDRMKTEFVSVASHQLQAPLAGIRLFTEMFMEEKNTNLTSEQRDFAKQIYLNTDRMVDLVQDLLNVARIEGGVRFVVVRKPVDAMYLAETAVREMRIMADAKKIKLETVFEVHGSVIVEADESKIRQAFQNLINNAIKYSSEGGVVTVGCDKPTREKITFFVRDTGVGIPKLQQRKIFEKFFRADNVVAAEIEGTGLGLYIVKAIIERHGGKIWFESEEGKGTTFRFTLPVEG